MNLKLLLAAIIGSARRIGAEKVLISKFDVDSTEGLIIRPCDDAFIVQVIPSIPGEPQVESPLVYASDAVAPGWAIFTAGGGLNLKDLSEWVPAEGE